MPGSRCIAEPVGARNLRSSRKKGVPAVTARRGRVARILLGYGGSDDAEAALAWATRIAESSGAPIHLVQALPLPAVPTLSSPEVITKIIRTNMKCAEDAVRKAAAGMAARGIEVTSCVRPWLSADTIVDAAEKFCADLIVIGRRRRSAFARLVESSISSQVVRMTRKDVLVAIQPPPEAGKLKVLVGIDGSSNSARALRSARKTFPAADLTALFVVHTGDERSARLLLRLAETAAGLHPNEIATVVRRGHPAQQIVREVEDRGHHLVVVGRRGMGPLKDLIIGSICDKLLNLSPVSMLVVK